MTLSDYTLPVPYEECRDLALVYSYETAAQLYETQLAHGDPRHVAVGLPLTDGRWMMWGEVLSAVGEGGILGWAVAHLTPEIMAQVEVLPMSEVTGLLPVPTEGETPELGPEPVPEQGDG